MRPSLCGVGLCEALAAKSNLDSRKLIPFAVKGPVADSPRKGSVYPISHRTLGQARSAVGDVHRGVAKTEIMFKRDTSGRWICTCGKLVDEHSREELSKCVEENNTIIVDGEIVITMKTVTHKTEQTERENRKD
jgi:hypothetical protein